MDRAVIFDMDGTLLDSSIAIVNSINHVRKSIGLKQLNSKDILQKVNDPTILPSKFFYNSDKFLDIHTYLFEDYYSKNCTKDTKLYNGIKDLLYKLKDDFILAVATNAKSKQANMMLEHMKIREFFKVVICSDMVKNPKPEPDILYKIIKDLNISADNLILVGDSYKDSLAAKKAGIESLLVGWGFSTLDKDDIINDTKQLEQKIYAKFNKIFDI